MRTPKLDELLASEYMEVNRGDFHIVSQLAKRLRAAVAEDIRAACEKAWQEGAEYCAVQPFDYEEISLDNPYARKAST